MSTANRAADLAVVIPAYNCADTIARAVGSALGSGAAEVIVVDDGSEDNTARIARELRCRLISQPNGGAAIARRTGIAAVQAAYCVLLDADDELVPEGVQESVRLLQTQGDLVAACGVTLGIGAGDATQLLQHWPEGVSTESLLRRGYPPGPPAVAVWRTSALQAIHSDEVPSLWPRYAEDYELWVRGSLLGRVADHPSVSCRYRWVGGKSSARPLRDAEDAESIRRHYGQVTGHAIVPRSLRELRGRAWLRRAAEYNSPRYRLHRWGLMAMSVAADPRPWVRGAFRRLRRLSSRHVS